MYVSVSVARMSKDDSPCWGDGEACLDDHIANGSLHRASVLTTWESGRVQKLGSVRNDIFLFTWYSLQRERQNLLFFPYKGIALSLQAQRASRNN